MYYFYLGEILLPVAPEKVSTKISGKNKTVTLINDGEINLLKSPGLAEYKFKVLLPNMEYPFAKYPDGYHPGGYFLDALEQLMSGAKPFRFRILRCHDGGQIDWSTDTKATLEDYSIEEDAEEGTDFVADITLKKYRDWNTKVLVITGSNMMETTERRPEPIKPKPKGVEYTIRTGDTLWGLAQRFWGDGSQYHYIYTANKKALDDEAKKRGMGNEMGERWIFKDTKITIPMK